MSAEIRKKLYQEKYNKKIRTPDFQNYLFHNSRYQEERKPEILKIF